jgi:hypothetical protein
MYVLFKVTDILGFEITVLTLLVHTCKTIKNHNRKERQEVELWSVQDEENIWPLRLQPYTSLELSLSDTASDVSQVSASVS